MIDEENPFASPDADQLRKYSPGRDPSVDHEPHRLEEEFLPDVAHQADPAGRALTPHEAVDHGVWDEPGLSPDLRERRATEAVTYERWLQSQIHATSWRTSHQVTALVGIFSGVVAGTLAVFLGLPWTIVTRLNILGSIIEEVLKIAIAAWVVEKRPYLFKSEIQIFVAVASSGLGYALSSRLGHAFRPQPWLIGWGWTFFAIAQIACSASAALGLIRVWQDGIHNLRKPQLSKGAGYFGLAVAIHVIYGLLR